MVTNGKAVSRAISLRAATPEDTAFLLEVFSSTRDEFKMLIADESQLAALMSMQFNFQQQQYQDSYPDGQDNIIISEGQPIGRIFTAEGDRLFTLVDIALLPQHRNAGIGGRLLENLLIRAAQAAKPVALHVLKTNPARNLYERIGFRILREDSMYYEMISEPHSA
jgi:ribosomal protein S18 acetylase RimI-like enzyme